MRDQPEVIRKRVKEWLDSGQDQLSDELADIVNDAHGFMVRERFIDEAYAAGRLEVRLDALVKEVDGHRSHYRVVVSKGILELTDKLSPIGMNERGFGARRDGGERERMMLVEVREFDQLPQNMSRAFLRVQSIGLEGRNDFESPQRDGIEFSQLDGLVKKIVLGESDGELCLSGWCGVIRDGQFVRDVVERGSQVVNGIADDRGEVDRWLFGDVELDSWFAVARIALHRKSIRTRIQVSDGLVIERYEMHIGPPQLFDDSCQRVVNHVA